MAASFRHARYLVLPLALFLMGAEPCNPCDDADGDGVCDVDDVCPGGHDLADTDGDAVPDDCDLCPLDAPDDADGNGTCDVEDAYPLDGTIRLDEVQVKGTHNSYHRKPLILFHPSHDYTHQPLGVQLADQGVRAFELDLHRSGSGLVVYHIAVVDALTTCKALEDCFQEIQTWSAANPHHLPVQVWFELKDDAGGGKFKDLDEVDAAIRAAFPGPRLLTPDDVQGAHPTLRAAIETDGWPTLGEVRGKVMVLLLEGGEYQEEYTYGHTTLAGRAMFAHASPGQFAEPWAAVSKINDPGSSAVAQAHGSGILVASNLCAADESDGECFADLADALDNGVHMMKDDFPAPVEGRTYWMDVADGNPARCNPVTAGPSCTSVDLEDLD